MKSSCKRSEWRQQAGLSAVAVLVGTLLICSPVWAAGDAVGIAVTQTSPDRVVIHYQFDDATIVPVKINGDEYNQLFLNDESRTLIIGHPEVPIVCRSIIIPDDGVMAINVLDVQYNDAKDINVAPSKGSISRQINPADVPYTFASVYDVNEYFPAQPAVLREPYIMRDYRGAVVEVHPFQYNPVSRTLRTYRSMTVEVVKKGPGGVNTITRNGRALSLAFHQVYKHHFLNYGSNFRYAPLDEAGDMLVICYDSWLSNIQPFVDHKNSIGINTSVVGVSSIGNNYNSIKNYIQNVYNTSDLAFVLLVGDGAQIDTPSASGGSSDPTYSKLAGSDNYPDIFVGRFSAESAAHVDTQVQRTITYETQQATLQDWFWRGTGIASNQGTGDDGEYDDEHIDNIRLDLLAHGYTVVDRIYDYTGTAAQVTSALNAGRGIINYCGHGSTTSWSSTGFSNTHVNALVNDNMLPFIFSVACVNGQFDGYTCFGEAWLRATHGSEPTGAIGAYMSSINQDWDPPMCAQDESIDLLCAEAYFSFGALAFAGSCQMMDEYGSSGVNMFNTWHVFGDPSVRVVGIAEPPSGLKIGPYDTLAASGPIGGPFTPGTTEYFLENKNETPLAYSVTCNEPWITITNGSGTLPALGTTSVIVSVNAAAAALASGAYSDVIQFTNLTDHEGDTTRDCTLQVGGSAWDPVAYSVNTTTAVSLATEITLFGSDPNSDALTYVIESLPASGYLADPNGGEISAVPYELAAGGKVVVYQPPCMQVLSDSFSYSVHDQTADSNTANVGVQITEADPRMVYRFPLDTDPGWSTEGDWAFGQPTGGGTHNYDPTSGHTGDNVYGYNLAGDYARLMPVYALTTTPIDCSNLTEVELRFWRWLGVEDGEFDQASIQVSANGVDWTTIWENPLTSATSESSWSQQIYDISAVADSQPTVYIRWTMGETDGSVQYPGWNIDDVEIWAMVPVIQTDFNGDGLVTMGDFDIFRTCLAGPDLEASFSCLCIDLDGNGAVDLADFAQFQAAFAE